jgi:hypothetical protein
MCQIAYPDRSPPAPPGRNGRSPRAGYDRPISESERIGDADAGGDPPAPEPRAGVAALVDELREEARSLSELPLAGVAPPLGDRVWP